MSIKDILAKVLASEGIADAIGEEGVKLLTEFDDTASEGALAKALEGLKGAEGKAAGILEEKKKAQEKLAEATKTIEEMKNSGLSDGEKLTLELETAQKAVQEATEKIEQLTGELGTTKRDHELDRLGATVKWMDEVPQDMRRSAIETAFKDVEDLADESKTKEVMDKLNEDCKGLIQADTVPNGLGGKGTPKDKGGPKEKDPSKQTTEERAAVIGKRMKARLGVTPRE